MRRALVVALVVLAALVAITTISMVRQSHELIPWQTDFKDAQLQSHQTGKPILLDFSADWCGPCQEMRRATWSDANVAGALHEYIPVQINIDSNPQLASQFEVRGIPHLVVLNRRGDIVKFTEGGMDPSEFLRWLGTQPPH